MKTARRFSSSTLSQSDAASRSARFDGGSKPNAFGQSEWAEERGEFSKARSNRSKCSGLCTVMAQAYEHCAEIDELRKLECRTDIVTGYGEETLSFVQTRARLEGRSPGSY